MKQKQYRTLYGDLLVLNGLIVIDEGGITLYCNTAGLEGFNLDPLLIGGFLSAIQSFAKEFDQDHKSYLRELSMHNTKLMYRQIEIYTFIGILEQKSNTKSAEIILEYMIWCFLSKYRSFLKDNRLIDTSKLSSFDALFIKYRASKEKELQKWLDTIESSYLQEILNKLTNYFPISEIVKIDPQNLTIIGKKIIWVNLSIKPEEEEQILNKLRENTNLVYGLELFNNIENEIKKKLSQ